MKIFVAVSFLNEIKQYGDAISILFVVYRKKMGFSDRDGFRRTQGLPCLKEASLGEDSFYKWFEVEFSSKSDKVVCIKKG